MEQSRSEPDSYSASQGVPRLLRNTKFHYSVHKRPPLVPILNQMHPVHNFPIYFPNIRSTIISASTPRTSKWSLHCWLSKEVA